MPHKLIFFFGLAPCCCCVPAFADYAPPLSSKTMMHAPDVKCAKELIFEFLLVCATLYTAVAEVIEKCLPDEKVLT